LIAASICVAHGVTNLFGDMTHDAQCPADQSKGFGDLPRVSDVQSNRANPVKLPAVVLRIDSGYNFLRGNR
jgi:hypothetical protein